MSRWRANPLFAASLGVGAFLALSAFALIYERWHASREAAAKLIRAQQDLLAMREVAPPPTRVVAQAIEADLAQAQQALAMMQAELKGRGPASERLRSAKAPAARTDAYFDLAAFVEKMRELAQKHEVEVRAEAARFGFATYTNEGPELEHIEPVFRQRLIAQYLVEALIDAKPRALLAVKREPPLSRAEREARDAELAASGSSAEPSGDAPVAADSSTLPEGPDFFAMDRRASVRTRGYVDANAFRLVFTGQTASLRAFLNRLARFELPVLVREVEVEPATAEEAANSAAEENASNAETRLAPSVVLTAEPAPPQKNSARSSSTLPIVAKPLSKFTVTVEYVELVPPPVEEAIGAPAATPTS